MILLMKGPYSGHIGFRGLTLISSHIVLFAILTVIYAPSGARPGTQSIAAVGARKPEYHHIINHRSS